MKPQCTRRKPFKQAEEYKGFAKAQNLDKSKLKQNETEGEFDDFFTSES